MSNTSFPFEESPEQPKNSEDTLSAEDLAVIQAFDALDSWETVPSDDAQLAGETQKTSSETQNGSEDMLITFATEVEEDIETMHRALQHIEHHGMIEPTQLLPLERAGHKLRGAAGAMECHMMATIAEHIENLSQRVMHSQIVAAVALPVLLQAVLALQTTLVNFFETGQESPLPLQELEEEIQRRSLDVLDEGAIDEDGEDTSSHPIHIDARSHDTSSLPGASLLRVDMRRLERLVRHSEQLAELHTPLESAQARMDAALQELEQTEQRLQHIERQFFTLLAHPHMPSPVSDATILSDSSLIARILKAGQSQGNISSTYSAYMRKNKLYQKTDMDAPANAHDTHSIQQWDELEMEHYTERDDLLQAFNEAVADVTMATNTVRTAYTQLSVLLQKYRGRTSITRNDILLLRSAPLRVLLPRLERAIHMSAAGREQSIQFEVSGEATELDQDILEALSIPLLQLLRTCITAIVTNRLPEQEQSPCRVHLRAQSIGNEFMLEIGFSMMVRGGILDAIREPIDQLNGTISLQRNAMGGVSFHLRLPRSQGAIRCLLVRMGDQQLIVPFSQIYRIEDARSISVDKLYQLSALLDLPPTSSSLSFETSTGLSMQPMVIPLQEPSRRTTVGITVDEVLDECEVMVKPLASYMQRPGISGSTIDGKGNVLLMLDLPDLITHYTSRQRIQAMVEQSPASQTQWHKPSILIADDSASIRQSLQHILSQKNYTLYAARDGMEALERLTEHPPNIFLLDMEMPNLNGYDLLSIMRLYPELADVKVIMLTSRSSSKHRQRALQMGAHAYLTKPCLQDILLETIEQLLAR